MRSLSKTIAGGVLAALLVLSASPAQAFGPTDLTPETEQTVLGNEAADDVGMIDVVDSAEVPSEAEWADEVEDTGNAESAEGSELPEPEVSAEELAEELTANDDEVKTEEYKEVAKPVSEAPAELVVAGTLLVIPNEAGGISADDLDTGVTPEASPGAVLVATDDLGFVSIDPSVVHGEVEAGASFAGTITLTDEAIEAVEERIAAEGDIKVVDVAGVAQEVAAATATPLVAQGAVTSAAAATGADAVDVEIAGAIAARSHAVDVVNFGGSYRSAASEAQIKQIVSDASSYWKAQTDGTVSSLPLSKYVVSTAKYSQCMNPNVNSNLWTQAVETVSSKTVNEYIQSGRHLIAFVNDNCSGAVGWGTIGSIHSGGVTWINLGSRPSTAGPRDLTASTIHEIGHNLGLGHGDARYCSSPNADGPTVGKNGVPAASSGCYDSEYMDIWNVMGI